MAHLSSKYSWACYILSSSKTEEEDQEKIIVHYKIYELCALRLMLSNVLCVEILHSTPLENLQTIISLIFGCQIQLIHMILL